MGRGARSCDVEVRVDHGGVIQAEVMMEKDGMQFVDESEKARIPMTSKGKSVEIDTPVPLDLKEICSLDLGGVVLKFVPLANFVKLTKHKENEEDEADGWITQCGRRLWIRHMVLI